MATPPPTALPLRVRGPAGGQPALLSDLTSASTLAELEAAARAALGIREGAAVALLAGFPPRRLGEGGDADAAAIALGSLGLRANEVVTAKEETGAAATVLQGQGAMPGGKRGKKAAGGAGSKRPAAAVAAVGGGGPNIHTLHGRASGSGSARSGGGGGGVGGKRRRAADVGKEQEDIAEVLALAASGGGGQHGAQLRAVFRRAVEHQFNEAKAAARVAAVAAGPTHYEIEESQEARRTDGSAARLKVKYHKGVGFRSAHEDDVELMSKATLAATVAMVLADTGEFTREMLKPEYMAGVSPRIFWSMVHHFGPDIEAALRQLLPAHTDWAFLHEKTRKLSEKALANQAQAEEDRRAKAAAAAEKKARREARLARGQKGKREGGEADGHGGRGEGAAVAASEGAAAAAAVVDVEGEDEGGATAAAAAAGAAVEAEERERRAQAALARLGGGGGGEQAATAVGGDGKAGGGEDAGEESEVDSDFPEIGACGLPCSGRAKDSGSALTIRPYPPPTQ